MNEGEPEFFGTLRLSTAIARLCAAGVGEVDVLRMIASAGLSGRIWATGFQSVCIGRKHTAELKRMRVHRRMWRILCHPEAKAKGYECLTRRDELVWTLSDGGDYLQEQFDIVLLDRPSFEIWLREVVDTYRPGKLSQTEIDEWIRAYPGSNSKSAWADFQRHFGPGACKRDVDFRPVWLDVHGNPQRGQPRKKSPALSPA